MKHVILVSILLATALASACSKKQPPSSSLEVAVKGLHSGALHGASGKAFVGSIHHGGSLWELPNRERVFNWNHKKDEYTTIVAADFSDDGRWLLSADVHTLTLWDTKSGRGERYWIAPGEILDVELNRSGSLALLGLSDHTAVIFDVRRGGIRRTFSHDNRVNSVDFSYDNRYAITGSEDYSATIWDTSNGKIVSQIKHENNVQLAAISDDGDIALSVSKYDKALVWKCSTGEVLGELAIHTEHIKRGVHFTSARFSADNKYLLTGRPDQSVQLWDLQSMETISQWTLPKRKLWKPTSAAVVDLAFADKESPPSLFYAASSNGFIHTLNRVN